MQFTIESQFPYVTRPFFGQDVTEHLMWIDILQGQTKETQLAARTGLADILYADGREYASEWQRYVISVMEKDRIPLRLRESNAWPRHPHGPWMSGVEGTAPNFSAEGSGAAFTFGPLGSGSISSGSIRYPESLSSGGGYYFMPGTILSGPIGLVEPSKATWRTVYYNIQRKQSRDIAVDSEIKSEVYQAHQVVLHSIAQVDINPSDIEYLFLCEMGLARCWVHLGREPLY